MPTCVPDLKIHLNLRHRNYIEHSKDKKSEACMFKVELSLATCLGFVGS